MNNKNPIKRVTTYGILPNNQGLTFEQWAREMNTPGINKVVNKYGVPISVADSPKIFPDPSCYSSHGIVHSNHGLINMPNVYPR